MPGSTPPPSITRPGRAAPIPAGNLVDRLILETDQALRTLFDVHASTVRPYPAEAVAETVTTPDERRRIASLMRVNHSGEVSAQALYHGQAWVARQPATRVALLEAAAEEGDHLQWCSKRIKELGGRTSLLNPLWYGGSFVIGAATAALGDATSLGFVAETERQVVEHLESHLEQLPAADNRTRAIVHQMRIDEAHHGGSAMRAGGIPLPSPMRGLMKLTAKIMTTAARLV